jgi:NADH dehydrogenase [ubiquinone] 1 alpha subcomplex assembly factor 7
MSELPGLCSSTWFEIEYAASLHGTLDQSSFLLRMGIAQRLAALSDKAQSEERRSEIGRAGKRLVDRAGQGMGRVYRVLGITGGRKTDVWPFIASLPDEADSEK